MHYENQTNEEASARLTGLLRAPTSNRSFSCRLPQTPAQEYEGRNEFDLRYWLPPGFSFLKRPRYSSSVFFSFFPLGSSFLFSHSSPRRSRRDSRPLCASSPGVSLRAQGNKTQIYLPPLTAPPQKKLCSSRSEFPEDTFSDSSRHARLNGSRELRNDSESYSRVTCLLKYVNKSCNIISVKELCIP